MPYLWDLNLDADIELSTRGPYTRGAKVANMVARSLPQALHLLGPGDLYLDVTGHVRTPMGESARVSKAYEGRAFCPTPLARKRLADAGVCLPASPKDEVLRRVNHRLFCSSLAPKTLPDRREDVVAHAHAFVTSEEALDAHVLAHSSQARWLLKRAFGAAGRGQRRVHQCLTAEDRSFVRASLAAPWPADVTPGLVVEPLVAVEQEYSVHGLVNVSGEVSVYTPRAQHVSPQGVWLGAGDSRATELDPQRADALREDARRVGQALHLAGYWGPFGVDAFTYTLEGRIGLRRLSEINARYTMAFASE